MFLVKVYNIFEYVIGSFMMKRRKKRNFEIEKFLDVTKKVCYSPDISNGILTNKRI